VQNFNDKKKKYALRVPHMTLPLFPLRLVAYPGEVLNLHIFEPRYRQMIQECLDQGTTFGIPTFMNDAVTDHGCEMQVTELVERHEDGRMDIRIRGVRIFQLHELYNPVAGKLYAGGEVDFWEAPEAHPAILPSLIELVNKLYTLLKEPLKANPDLPQPYSYQIGHLIGLQLEDEYELLTIKREFERQEYLMAHLQHVLPIMEDMERTKARIQMNGHFRTFGELDF
jgi:Lon protease-like protein